MSACEIGMAKRCRQQYTAVRPAEKQIGEMARTFPRVFTLDDQKYTQFFLYRGDRQMTEVFVSGTEVFSDAKMTESPYE